MENGEKRMELRPRNSEVPAKRARMVREETAEEKLSKEVFGTISDGDLDGLKKIHEEHSFSTEIRDENNLTPLILAVKLGKGEIVRWLLDRGADINPRNCIPALHTAASNGHTNLCSILLEAGAKKEFTDNHGLTASVLAFVTGKHECMFFIRNFITEEQLKFYTLDPSLVQPFRKFIMTPYIHPVKVTSEIPIELLIKNNAEKTVKVLQEMVKDFIKKQIKDNEEMVKDLIKTQIKDNEVMAFRFHYFANILAEVYKTNLLYQGKRSPTKIVIKRMLKSKAYTDEFLQGCIQMFPFKNCKLFDQMVDSLFKHNKSMNALTVILTLIGKRHIKEYERSCSVCGKNNINIKCCECKDVQYCDQKCQRIHWYVHKEVCERRDAASNGTSQTSDDSSLVTKSWF